ncbi:MAG: LysR family transcriptional regulator [Burkholderiales bacterium]|nr:LysR family transcriptional regulator [Burkholderiales bacterium]
MPKPASLDDLALFVEVARSRSFSRASANLGVPGATLSRRIAGMERRLGVRLFDRTTRRVELTEPAQRYFERCAPLVDEAGLAHEALRAAAERPSGHLRVSMPVDLGIYWIGPLLPEFARQHPGISFELDLSSRHSDLIADHIDVAFRLGAVKGDQLIARRIGALKQALFAAPDYLDRHGRPQQPAELVEHDCLHVAAAPRAARWRFRNGSNTIEVGVRGRFALNNVGLMRLLAERAMGIAMLPPSLAREGVVAGRLEQVLPDYTLPEMPLHAVLSSRLQPAAVRAFVDFMATRLASQ